MIEMRGDNPMLTSKLYILLNISASSWQMFMRLLYRNSFDEMIKMRGNTLLLTTKLHILLDILGPCWQIFMTLLLQGFFWWDNQHEGWQPYANFKAALFVKYHSSMLMDFHKDFYNRDFFVETIKMRGNSPMLTTKLHIFLNILAPCW